MGGSQIVSPPGLGDFGAQLPCAARAPCCRYGRPHRGASVPRTRATAATTNVADGMAPACRHCVARALPSMHPRCRTRRAGARSCRRRRGRLRLQAISRTKLRARSSRISRGETWGHGPCGPCLALAWRAAPAIFVGVLGRSRLFPFGAGRRSLLSPPSACAAPGERVAAVVRASEPDTDYRPAIAGGGQVRSMRRAGASSWRLVPRWTAARRAGWPAQGRRGQRVRRIPPAVSRLRGLEGIAARRHTLLQGH